MTSGSFLHHSLAVASGGALGAWTRFCVSRAWIGLVGPVAAAAFPWATLAVNLLGSLAMGLLAGWLARHGHGGEGWRLLLGVGVLGGFTTFSAFSLELAGMIERGAMMPAALYAALSLAGGIAALFAGLIVMRVAA